MELHQLAASPFSRKVRAVIVEEGLQARVRLVQQPPRDNSSGYFALNPFGRIPTLKTDDGQVLFDSPVICEYLDGVGGKGLIPASGPERFEALKEQALGDGLLDTMVLWRQERLRPQEHQAVPSMDYARGVLDRSLTLFESRQPKSRLSIGDIAIGTALGYVDFRFPDIEWRKQFPKLATWFQALSERESFATTQPS